MPSRKRIKMVLLIVAMIFGAVAFVCALIAVWQPEGSHARSGWGGTALVFGFTALICAFGGSTMVDFDD